MPSRLGGFISKSNKCFTSCFDVNRNCSNYEMLSRALLLLTHTPSLNPTQEICKLVSMTHKEWLGELAGQENGLGKLRNSKESVAHEGEGWGVQIIPHPKKLAVAVSARLVRPVRPTNHARFQIKLTIRAQTGVTQSKATSNPRASSGGPTQNLVDQIFHS